MKQRVHIPSCLPCMLEIIAIHLCRKMFIENDSRPMNFEPVCLNLIIPSRGSQVNYYLVSSKHRVPFVGVAVQCTVFIRMVAAATINSALLECGY